MKPMTHNQYVHYLIHKDDPKKYSKKVPVAPPRKNMHNLPATHSTLAKTDAPQPINEGQKMKALSIRQPYAGLIIAGIKNVENRTWNTNFSGQLVIVSTAKPGTVS